jgi:hypothetical protein
MRLMCHKAVRSTLLIILMGILSSCILRVKSTASYYNKELISAHFKMTRTLTIMSFLIFASCEHVVNKPAENNANKDKAEIKLIPFELTIEDADHSISHTFIYELTEKKSENNFSKRLQNSWNEKSSQITVILKKREKIKRIHLANYYRDDIGLIIELINSLTPKEYEIVYDKKELLESMSRCK